MNTEILAAREEWLPTVRTDHAMRKVPLETFVQVVEWHHAHHVPQYKLAKLAEAEGLEGADLLPAKTALSEFFSSFSPVLLSVLRRKAAFRAEEVLKAADESPVEWFRANREQLSERVFRMMRDPEADEKLLLSFIDRMNTLHAENTERAKLTIAERGLKLKEADEALRKKMEAIEAENAALRARIAAMEEKRDTSAEISDEQRKRIVDELDARLGVKK